MPRLLSSRACLVPVAEVAPDGQAALEEPERRRRTRPAAAAASRASAPTWASGAPASSEASSIARCSHRRPSVACPCWYQNWASACTSRRPVTARSRVGARSPRPGVQRPAQRGAQVVVLGLQPVQRRQLVPAAQLLVRLLGELRRSTRHAGAGCPPAHRPASRRSSAYSRIVSSMTDPRLAVGALGHRDQADVHQLGGQLQRVGPRLPGRGLVHGDRRQRVQVAAPGEHPRTPEHRRGSGVSRS